MGYTCGLDGTILKVKGITSGIEESEMKQQIVSVYPNPVKEKLNINSDNTIQQITIYDSLGKQLKQEQPQSKSYEFDMSELPENLYFIEITNVDGNRLYQKIIRE